MSDYSDPEDVPTDPVPMVHFECRQCEMSATCVVTPVVHDAWQAHMDTHEDRHGFDAWTWSVVKLPLT